VCIPAPKEVSPKPQNIAADTISCYYNGRKKSFVGFVPIFRRIPTHDNVYYLDTT
jgi:hypothetical protein